MSNGEKEGKEASLQGDIFPLHLIPDHWLLVNSLISSPLPAEEAGPVHALRATLHLLKNLYYFDDNRWLAIRDSLNLGVIKDTKLYGNTSVSMGAAKMVFARNLHQRSAGFLNCGTGGIKYQRYDGDDMLHVVGELKPKDAASPNCLKLGAFTPKQEVSFEDTDRLLARDLKSEALPWTYVDKRSETDTDAQQEGIPMYAFVTGLIRQHWEEADEKEKLVLETAMQQLFMPYGIKPLTKSYFMTQDDEGRLELMGAQAMYGNLVRSHILESGLHVVGSFGVGRGSCQWMTLKADGSPSLVGHKAGMSNLPKLANVGQALMQAYADPNTFQTFLDSLKGIDKPVVALKSGAALLFDSKQHKHLKDTLRAAVKYPTRTVEIALVSDPTRAVKFTWTGSLDRLCAEGAIKLKADSEMETVYRMRADKTLVLITNDSDIKEKELLLLGPIVMWTEKPAEQNNAPTTASSPTTTTSTTTTPVTTTSPTSVPSANKTPPTRLLPPSINTGKAARWTLAGSSPRRYSNGEVQKSPSNAWVKLPTAATKPAVSPRKYSGVAPENAPANPKKGSETSLASRPPWR